MGLTQKLDNDLKAALKSQNKVKLSTLRMLKSAIHNKEILNKGTQLEEAEVIKIISKQMQQRKDSVEQFKKGNRADLVEQELQELKILQEYLPEQLSEEDVVAAVKKVVADLGAKNKSEFGNVMKAVMTELKGKADGKIVSRVVSEQLSA